MSRSLVAWVARISLALLLITLSILGVLERLSTSAGGLLDAGLPYTVASVLEGLFGVLLLARPHWRAPALLIALGFIGAWIGTVAHVALSGHDVQCRCLGPIETTPWLAMALQGVIVLLAGVAFRLGVGSSDRLARDTASASVGEP